jgi:hypothetical protein
MSKNTPLMTASSVADEAATQSEHQRRAELHGAFGNDAFGQMAESAARFFGTPKFARLAPRRQVAPIRLVKPF